jgi:HEAT repeat protein
LLAFRAQEIAFMNRLLSRGFGCLLGTIVAFTGSAVGGEPKPQGEDEQTLHAAGLAIDGPALIAFFQARARTSVDRNRLEVLLRQFAADSNRERSLATAELLGLGPLAIPALRRTANNLENPEAAANAARCLEWLEGALRPTLPAAAARVLALRKPEGAAGVLLAYLPLADNPDVVRAVTTALAAVAAPGGKPDPALLRGLADPLAVRRAAAGSALALAAPPERVPEVRKLLKDPAPSVRLRTALALAEANDAEAIPVLIELLGELPAQSRQPVEEFLTHLAGEWMPAANFQGEDDIARGIRRDAWKAWWKNVEGPDLLALIRKHTLTAKDRTTIRDLIAKLGAEGFAAREKAAKDLFAFGRRSLPQLRETVKSPDAETARRAKQLVERIEREPAHHLPAAALRILAVRKPSGSVEALLAYFPYAEDETLTSEGQKSLALLAMRDGKLDPALLRALSDKQAALRAIAAEALAKGGGTEGRAAVRKLLKDDAPSVRLRVALTLAALKEREGVPVLIDLLTVLPSDDLGEVEDALYQLAGETAPDVVPGNEPAERQKCRDAWIAWWKTNEKRVDLGRLTERKWLGFTVICDSGGNRVFEIDRHGKQRWAIENVMTPLEAVVLAGNRVLIAEYGANRVTERDFKGKVRWEKQVNNPINVQRLPNGNTFIASQNGAIVEVDRAGKEVYSINNVPGNVLAACRSRKGDIFCLTQTGQCSILDTTGKQLKSFATNHGPGSLSGLDVLPNGRILVTNRQTGKVTEFDAEGKSILEVDAPGAVTASTLPNGHVLAASQNPQRVFELDRKGKVVWEYKGTGLFYRARRR